MSESDERTVCAAGAGLERSGEKRFVQTHGSARTERHPAVIEDDLPGIFSSQHGLSDSLVR
jgi:hypothetical protein